jgi:hypothetical protein
LSKLTGYVGLDCSGSGSGAPTQASGAWYDPKYYGTGFLIEQLTATRVPFVYFGFDAGGKQIWMVGEADRAADGSYGGQLLQPTGTHFGAAFDKNQIVQRPFGMLQQTFFACANGSAQFGFGSANPPLTSLSLKRITVPAGIPNCDP